MLEPETEILVTEMGMRGLGQIAELCAIARPDVAVVSSIGPEHLELVGTVGGRRGERGGDRGAAAGGIAVVPADATELEPHLHRDDIEIHRFDARPSAAGHEWTFPLPGGEITLTLPFTARHMAENTFAALTAYEALGLSLDRAQEGANAITLSRWRGEEAPLPGGGIVVNDAYNANPTSMRAALVDLAARAGGRRRVAILGEMAELGAAAPAYHEEVGALLDELGIELVDRGRRRCASLSRRRADAHAALDPRRCSVRRVAGLLQPGDAILVKASRAVGLEGIPASIEKRARAWSES